MHLLEKHPLVDSDLEEAALGYGRRDPSIAEVFISAAETAMRAAAADPLRFPPWIGDCRRVRLPGFPYAVLFELREQTIYVAAIAHMSRDLPVLVQKRAGDGQDPQPHRPDHKSVRDRLRPGDRGCRREAGEAEAVGEAKLILRGARSGTRA